MRFENIDREVAAIVDDIENEVYLSADEFRSDVLAASKAHGVSYGKVLSLIEAELKRVNTE